MMYGDLLDLCKDVSHLLNEIESILSGDCDLSKFKRNVHWILSIYVK